MKNEDEDTMRKLTAQDPETKSPDIAAANLAALQALFPEVVAEGPDGAALNLDLLKQLVGDRLLTDAEEKYGLNWHGKRRARKLALMPSNGTLRPSLEDSVDWDSTQNIMIEGDNLEVLKLLQKSYAGKVKLIYIDPPYNTGKDFVYPDNFQDNIKNYLELTRQVEGGQKVSSNTDASGRFHTDWLNMMYPRLKLARNLLSENGIAIIHIDEHEQHSLTMLLHEIFGEENDLGVCVWDKRNPKGDARGIAYQHESIAVVARNADVAFAQSPLRRLKRNAQRMLESAKEAIHRSNSIEDATQKYREWLKTQDGLSGGEAMYARISSDGRVYRLVSMAWPNKRKAPDPYFLPLIHPATNKPCPIPQRGWRNPPETMKELLAKGLIEFGPDETTQPQRRYFLDENIYENVPSILPYGGSDDTLFKEFGIPFDQPKPVEFAAALIGWGSSDHDIVLDFFAGSGTTGHGVMIQNAADQANRRYILVQLPEPLDPQKIGQEASARYCDELGKPRTIAELTKERLRLAAKKVKAEYPKITGDLGFRVFKLDTSNIQEWDPNRDDIAATLEAHVENLKQDRTEQDILFELLLKLGLDLTVPIETKKMTGSTKRGHDVYSIGGGVLLVCLSKTIVREDAEPLARGIIAWHKEQAPAGDNTVVFRDSAFSDDVAKTNLTEILIQSGLSDIKSV